jgi:hypothetical protein
MYGSLVHQRLILPFQNVFLGFVIFFFSNDTVFVGFIQISQFLTQCGLFGFYFGATAATSDKAHCGK